MASTTCANVHCKCVRGEEKGREVLKLALWVASFILVTIIINVYQLQVCTCYNPEACTPQDAFEKAWKVSTVED